MTRQPGNWLTALACATAMVAGAAAAQNVKVTSLGTHDGEFCAQDRALIFEDPNGTRILYDPGRSVMGGEDPRLGKIDIILVSHMHGDHAGNAHVAKLNDGECGNPPTPVKDTPNSNAVNIALARKAKMVTGGEMQAFFAAKLAANGGSAGDSILARFGGTRTVGGVKISTVNALHSNGLDPDYIGGDLAEAMKKAGFSGYVGEATGYVVRFTNGLVAYLSGDTGMVSEMVTVVRNHYHANFSVMNIGDNFTTGPTEAAYVINDLVKPATVMASHANEAATQGGKVKAGTKTEAFMKASKVPVIVPLSGKAYELDGHGKCVAGC